MNKSLQYILMISLTFSMNCTENGIRVLSNTMQFESDKLGMPATENELTIKINFARAVTSSDTITLRVLSTTLEYGVHFTTDPATENEELKLPFPANASSVAFQVKRKDGEYPRDGDGVKFSFKSTTGPLVAINKTELTLSFTAITAIKADMDPGVGGPSQPNIVFVDLSANRQTAVPRDAWDLGFYTMEGEFRVVLNTTSAMMARQLDKSDMAAVTAADTAGLGADLAMDVNTVVSADEEWQREAKNWIDDPAGDLTKTAIAEVSVVEDDNKVYAINRGISPDGTARGWKKIRVLRNGTGYELQHADIDEVTPKVIRLDRDEAYLFNYVNFDTGITPVEPKKEQWDLAFSVFTVTTAFGPPGSPQVPYQFSDMVIQNRHRVETAQVLTAEVGYAAFVAADVENVTFATLQTNIGANWRKGGGPSSAPSLKTDRFYVVKDVQGNIYKLLFTALTQEGERGRPSIQYELIKEAE